MRSLTTKEQAFFDTITEEDYQALFPIMDRYYITGVAWAFKVEPDRSILRHFMCGGDNSQATMALEAPLKEVPLFMNEKSIDVKIIVSWRMTIGK